MNKSGLRIGALALLLTAGPSAAPAQSLTAEQALHAYRRTFPSPRQLDCPKGEGSEEIVVCARPRGVPDPNRLPLPVASEPGARIAGEALSDGGGCIQRCPQPLRIDLMKVPGLVGKLIDRLRDD